MHVSDLHLRAASGPATRTVGWGGRWGRWMRCLAGCRYTRQLARQRWWVGLLAGATLLGAAHAQQANSREQEQLRRLRQQLQQLQQEQTSAQQQAQRAAAESSKLAEQLKAEQAAAARLQSGAVARGRALATLQQELATLKSERDALLAELGRTKESQGQTVQQLERSNGELNGMRQRLLASDANVAGLLRERMVGREQLEKCTAHNTELLRVGQELLGRYGNFGLGESLALREPFLQLKRVQLENLAQDYRSRLDEQRYQPQPATQPR